ncbi:hypothetical protein KGQ20_43710 [Catenulispora sp. NF23]|uniref:DUF5753 domain-containing protein n=1 Tax=Catenulispora pinistramenti TaxID=2705254 RepID=A0ABS5L8N2_9ACTN|nr:hypothetical protein [Catenulispora pinistramenti]MBS2539672.1 hypothetical protein [Catenulispora pinistramenti]MBS2554430.1 hypothetical protein [Catenulispora pinistramenti]
MPQTPEQLSDHDVIRRTNIPRSTELTLTDQHGTHHLATFTLLHDGRLRFVLADYTCAPSPLNMLIVPERADVSRVRLLRDFLAERIATISGP